MKQEILNSDCDVRAAAARNPNTPAELLTELAKDSDWGVRAAAACNPNTPAELLTELAKDSHWGVRAAAACNPKFVIGNNYVAIQGTTNIWYKHHFEGKEPFYTCGCFIGSKTQLNARINMEGGYNMVERKRILAKLDEKFQEVFIKK